MRSSWQPSCCRQGAANVGSWDGIVILGRFDADLAVLTTHQGSFTATVEGANTRVLG